MQNTVLADGEQPTKRVPLTIAARFSIFSRDDFTCVYCGKRTNSPEVDHVVPVSAGGDNDWRNLATSCWKCNRGKSAKRVDLDMNGVCSSAVERIFARRWPAATTSIAFDIPLPVSRWANWMAALTYDDMGDIPAMIEAATTAPDCDAAIERMMLIRDVAWNAYGMHQQEEL